MGYKAAWRSPASARSAPHLSLVVEGGTSRAVAGQACGMDRNCPLAQPLGQVSSPEVFQNTHPAGGEAQGLSLTPAQEAFVINRGRLPGGAEQASDWFWRVPLRATEAGSEAREEVKA